MLADNGIAISMDGKGAWRDNVFVERLWRSVKYEGVYLRAYDSVGEARQSIGQYLDFYNGRRTHSSLDGRTPDQAYVTPLPVRMAAYPRQRLHLSTRKICSDNRDHLNIALENRLASSYGHRRINNFSHAACIINAETLIFVVKHQPIWISDSIPRVGRSNRSECTTSFSLAAMATAGRLPRMQPARPTASACCRNIPGTRGFVQWGGTRARCPGRQE